MLKTAEHAPPSEAAGILYAGAAYSLWGLFPLYWALLSVVPPLELSIHRMLWCALFAAGVDAGLHADGTLILGFGGRLLLAGLRR